MLKWYLPPFKFNENYVLEINDAEDWYLFTTDHAQLCRFYNICLKNLTHYACTKYKTGHSDILTWLWWWYAEVTLYLTRSPYSQCEKHIAIFVLHVWYLPILSSSASIHLLTLSSHLSEKIGNIYILNVLQNLCTELKLTFKNGWIQETLHGTSIFHVKKLIQSSPVIWNSDKLFWFLWCNFLDNLITGTQLFAGKIIVLFDLWYRFNLTVLEQW